ncbi:MAG TPA: hypothetical protein VHY79_08420 [Rhizomicrobium sp.]|jgi:hypothetical protein|nr:hypothetical protein [Rhizomicrobium sp.]
MNGAFVSALAALGGSVVGGVVSGAATWLSQRSQLEDGTRARQLAYREDLFRDFIVAATNAYSQAMLTDKPELHDFVPMYGMINRMQVICSPRTVAAALPLRARLLKPTFSRTKPLKKYWR